ncbi:MAG: DoxX family protein, partial [Verrucomicrobiota bacterium]
MNPVKLSKPALYTSWILQLVVAFVLLQTIPFKFSGAPETVALFKAIGAEPWGRYVVGVFELVGGVLILVPKTIWLGALVSGFTMLGAVLTHLFKIGITVKDAAGDVIFGP